MPRVKHYFVVEGEMIDGKPVLHPSFLLPGEVQNTMEIISEDPEGKTISRRALTKDNSHDDDSLMDALVGALHAQGN